MYARMMSSGKMPTEEWLDQAFAPLKDYLSREYPDKKDDILGYLVFMGNDQNLSIG